MGDVVIETWAGVIAWISPSVTGQLGHAPQDLVGSPLIGLVHPSDHRWVGDRPLAGDLGDVVRHRARLRDRDGAWHWYEAKVAVVPEPDGIDGKRAVSTWRDIGDEMAVRQDLERRLQHDELTGLLTRGEFLQRLAETIGGRRVLGGHAGVLYCDVDSFKSVNDTQGHLAGDELLRVIATRFLATVRSGDAVARIGGDEILVALNGVRHIDDATRLAEALRRSVGRPIGLRGGVVKVSISAGVTLAHPGEEVEAVIARADRALYQAKHAGRDRMVTILSDGGTRSGRG